MTVIAGLFDSDADATQAMDRVLTAQLKDLDVRVVGPGKDNRGDGGAAVPMIPNTSGGLGSGGSGVLGTSGLGAALGRDTWLDKLDEVESTFYYEGMREGATLVIATLDEADSERARQMLRDAGARTYKKE